MSSSDANFCFETKGKGILEMSPKSLSLQMLPLQNDLALKHILGQGVAAGLCACFTCF